MAKTQIPAADVQDSQPAKEKRTELSAAAADKFSLVKTIKPGRYRFPGFGEVDLTTMSLEKAENLVKNGFPYLILKNKKNPDQDTPAE